MMKNLYDIFSLFYLGTYTGCVVTLWVCEFHWLVYGVLLFSAIGVQVVHHNHIHLGIWRSKPLNRLTELYISAVTAVPSAMMYGSHVKNHHVHNHGHKDLTRTYRFGDHNHLVGYLLHPIQAYFVLMPKFIRDFMEGVPTRSRFTRDLLLQSLLILVTWLVLAIMDWQKFLLFLVLPQMFGVHWLLGANYFQHAHCDGESDVNYARNFTGGVNWIWLNIGFHTAHHNYPNAHWSTLRHVHEEKCQHVDPRLCCDSFLAYVIRTFFLSLFLDSCRSKSLREQVELTRGDV